MKIASVDDEPARTGMGSSKALALARRTTLPPRELAEAAGVQELRFDFDFQGAIGEERT